MRTVVRPKYTNKHGLPPELVAALVGSGERHFTEGRISVTQLINPPIQRILMQRHAHEVEEDVADFQWRLLGTGVHYAVEQSAKHGPDAFTEEKLTAEVEGWALAGKADHFNEDGVITDFKTTSVFAFVLGPREVKPEWEKQLNVYAWLYREHGFDVHGLRIIAILRDWSATKAMANPDWPDCAFKVVEVPLWDHDLADAWIRERVREHQRYEPMADEALPICSPEDRWQKETKYAVMKEGRKSAVKLHKDKAVAEQHIQALNEGGKGKHYLDVREGEDTKCLRFCPVARFCPHGKTLLEEA